MKIIGLVWVAVGGIMFLPGVLKRIALQMKYAQEFGAQSATINSEIGGGVMLFFFFFLFPGVVLYALGRRKERK